MCQEKKKKSVQLDLISTVYVNQPPKYMQVL